MLQLKDIRKVYKIGDTEQVALKKINLSFSKGEFVAILGPSGCGKTTMLNLIGGLDRYTSGDLIINGKSTKAFKNGDWDAYRNNSIGFIFQNYNLIHHISILDNVEMSMTLSGVSKSVRREKAIEVLKRVGLEHHLHKKPNQLSGGQKQRVAIARALANDPDIILADEPTGALDTKTSVEVLDLIKEISKEKLVIMVTHNQELADKYASRIVKLLDGEVICDSLPNDTTFDNNNYKIKKTSMSFFTALKLSFNNLKTKIVRTLITALAGSIGIIGIALVLSINNGFTGNIKDLEQSTFSGFPLTISKYKMEFTSPRHQSNKPNEGDEIVPFDPYMRNIHINKFTKEYVEYVEKLDKNLYSSMQKTFAANLNILIKNEFAVNKVEPNSIGWNELYANDEFTKTQYDIVEGRLPKDTNEIVVIIDNKNQLDKNILSTIGFDITKTIKFKDIIGAQIVIGKNDDIYVENVNLNTAYENGKKLTVVGVLKGKSDGLQVNNRGIYYKNGLIEEFIKEAKTSNICIKQESLDYNVLNGKPFEGSTVTKQDVLQQLGCDDTPTSIIIYPKDSNAKSQIKTYLELYNVGKSKEDQILFDDLSELITSMLGRIVNMISSILVAFASISLVVSSIMIGIITYVSVLERTKEIGILRSLGARKKDISRVFNAETTIIGLVAGLLGVLITYLLSLPINLILNKMAEGLNNVVRVSIVQSLILILISIVLTFIAGLIPSRIAAKKKPVDALRHNE